MDTTKEQELHSIIDRNREAIAKVSPSRDAEFLVSKLHTESMIAGSQLSAIASARSERQTAWIIKLTKALVILTAALLLFSIVAEIRR